MEKFVYCFIQDVPAVHVWTEPRVRIEATDTRATASPDSQEPTARQVMSMIVSW